ncbi:hypothetical protein GGR58DRAFT_527100 [Xylaria digitata]|nr:hypothetical protein GGR58DRAFT_527100 [Xylaria digitata]
MNGRKAQGAHSLNEAQSRDSSPSSQTSLKGKRRYHSMLGDPFQITASGKSFINVGDAYHLGSLELSWDHIQARQKRLVRETGEWLHDSETFTDWLSEPNSFLWLRGIAGCGKTILSSTIIDYCRNLEGCPPTAGYYFNAREDDKRNVSRFLRSLLLQLCPAEGVLPAKVNELCDKCFFQDFSDDQLFGALECLIQSEEQTYIIIDALDECDTSIRSDEAGKLAGFLLRLTRIEAPNLHLLVTSRTNGLDSVIDQELRNIMEGVYRHEIDLQKGEAKGKIDADIEKFVEFELECWDNRKDRLWLPLAEVRRRQVARSVKGRANGMFRLAACLLDLLWRKSSWNELELALNDLPPDLPEAYDRIFKDIESQGQKDTASMLIQWLLYSERPLSLQELTEVTLADSQGDSFNTERGARDESYVSLTLSSFVIISEDNLVQFAHQTVKDYFLSDTTEGGLFTRKANSQAFITNCCLAYMQFCDQFNPECKPSHDARQRCPGDYVLLEYVFNNWYRHAVLAWENQKMSDTLDEFESSLKATTTTQKATTRWGNWLRSLVRIDDNSESENHSQSLSEWAAYVKTWLKKAPSLELAPYHNTLKAFACKGYEWSTKLLFTTMAPIIVRGEYFDSNVLTTALLGNYKFMLQLMQNDAVGPIRIDCSWWPREQGQTIEAHIFSYTSHEEIVRLLLEHGLDVNSMADFHEWTALHIAALRGHEATVRVLLEKGADIYARDRQGRTALHIASSRGYDRVTRLLLEKGADPGAKDNAGWTALDLAIRKAVINFNLQTTRTKFGYGDFERDHDLMYSGGLIAPQTVESNDETIAHTLRLILERGANSEDRDTETPRPISRGITEIIRPSRIETEIIHGGAIRTTTSVTNSIELHEGIKRLVMPLVDRFTLRGGSVQFGMSLIEQLLMHRQFFTFASVTLSGILRLYRLPIDSTITLFNVISIWEGTATFSAAAQITKIAVRGGIVAFSAAARIADIGVLGGIVNFSSEAQITKINVFGGSVTFSAAVQITEIHVWGGNVTLSAAAQITEMHVEGGNITFSAAAQIGEMDIQGGNVNFSAVAKITEIGVSGGMGGF